MFLQQESCVTFLPFQGKDYLPACRVWEWKNNSRDALVFNSTVHARCSLQGLGTRELGNSSPWRCGEEVWEGWWLQSLSRCLWVCLCGRCGKLLRRAISLFRWQSHAFPCSPLTEPVFPKFCCPPWCNFSSRNDCLLVQGKQASVTQCFCCLAPGLLTRRIISGLASLTSNSVQQLPPDQNLHGWFLCPFPGCPFCSSSLAWQGLVLEFFCT